MPRGVSRRLKVSMLDPADPDEVAEYFEGVALEEES
jgi:hypothetical protein